MGKEGKLTGNLSMKMKNDTMKLFENPCTQFWYKHNTIPGDWLPSCSSNDYTYCSQECIIKHSGWGNKKKEITWNENSMLTYEIKMNN